MNSILITVFKKILDEVVNQILLTERRGEGPKKLTTVTSRITANLGSIIGTSFSPDKITEFVELLKDLINAIVALLNFFGIFKK